MFIAYVESVILVLRGKRANGLANSIRIDAFPVTAGRTLREQNIYNQNNNLGIINVLKLIEVYHTTTYLSRSKGQLLRKVTGSHALEPLPNPARQG